MTEFDEVLEELILWLHSRNYDSKSKEWAKLQILYFIFKTCESEQTMKDICLKLDNKEN